MKLRWPCSLLVALGALLPPSVSAAEPVFEFVEALRNRGYFDTAEEYLDKIEKSAKTPATTKSRIPYERAITLTRSVDSIKSAKLQHKQLDRAASYLEQFLKASPSHPLADNAKSVRARIFYGKTEVNIIELQGPGSPERKAELRKTALANIGKARSEFASALIGYEVKWKAFGTFIPVEEKELREQRRLAEGQYITTQIDLAKCSYTEAHIYGRKDKEFRDKLTDSFKAFEKVHSRYRSMGYGLYARMWQGKCFEEQGEIGRALGIYNELLAHEGKSRLMKMIQREAMHFKLICLNDPTKHDYQLVVDFAIEWEKQNRRYRTTPTGLGVKYELARAREILGTVSEEITEKKDKDRFLTLAKADAQFVARYSGKYQLRAAMLLDKIKRLRGDKIADPTNFSDAFTAAMVVYSSIKPRLDAYRKAKAARKPQKELDELKTLLKSEVDETDRLHRMTQRFFKRGEDTDKLNRSRYYSAYVAYLLDQHFDQRDKVYDGAVLAEFVSRHAKVDNPDQAMDAAYLAMVLYIRAYNHAVEGQRQAEIRWILKTGKYLVSNWANAKHSAEASLNIGKLYNKRNDPLAAGRWFSRVPETSKDFYAQSRIFAGHAYWDQFVTASGLPPQRKILLAEMRKKLAEDLIASVANILNPTHRKMQFAIAQRDALLPASQPAAKPPATQPPKAASPKEPLGKKKQAEKKPPAKKLPVSPAVAALNQQIQSLSKQSSVEIKAALAQFPDLNPEGFATFAEPALRSQLLSELTKLPIAEITRRHEQSLAKLSDEQLKAFFDADLVESKELAAKYLRIGIARLQDSLPDLPDENVLKKSSPATLESFIEELTDLATAKVSLAGYLRTKGQYKQIIELLKGGSHSVVAMIGVVKAIERKLGIELKRQKNGITGRPFGGEVQQLLLRSYVGTQDIDAAIQAMTELEKTISAEDADRITDIYAELGKQLQKEIVRLRNRDDSERLQLVRESFNQFLEELSKREDKLDFATLIWVAETYFNLGEGLGDSPDAVGYYESADSAYVKILGRPDIDANRTLIVKLRQVGCKRKQQKFADAIDTALEVLAKKPDLISAQTETAFTFQKWGESGEFDKHLVAINGIKDKSVWGWAGTARLLRRLIDSSNTQPNERADYEQRYLQSRYYISTNRLSYGVSLSPNKTDKKRAAVLGSAMAEMLDFATGFGVIDDLMFKDQATGELVSAKPKFDALFRRIQEEMGRSGNQITRIEWPKPQPKIKKQSPIAKKTAAEPALAKTIEKKKKKTEPETSSSLGLMIAISLVLLGGGGWFVFKSSKQGKNRRNLYAGLATGNPFDSPQTAVGTTKTSTAKKKPAATKRVAGAAKRPTQTKSKGKPTGDKPAAARRPKRPPGKQT